MNNSYKITKNKEELIKENYNRLPNGQLRLKKGSKLGRMKKRGYTLLDLTKVAMEYDKTHDVSILKHYIEQLKIDNRLLENFINKYVPTKTINELTGAGGEPININLIKTIYSENINESNEQ